MAAVVIWIVFCLCLCNASICKIHGPPNQRHTRDKYTPRRKNAWRSSIRPHNIRDAACESPFKLFEGRDRLEGHKGLQTTRLIWFPSLPLFTFLFEDLQYALFGCGCCCCCCCCCCCSEMPSFTWRSKILGREHVVSSPTSLSPDSMVMIKLSCYVFKLVKQYNLLFGLFFGYFGYVGLFVCSCYVRNYCNTKTYKESYEGWGVHGWSLKCASTPD